MKRCVSSLTPIFTETYRHFLSPNETISARVENVTNDEVQGNVTFSLLTGRWFYEIIVLAVGDGRQLMAVRASIQPFIGGDEWFFNKG